MEKKDIKMQVVRPFSDSENNEKLIEKGYITVTEKRAEVLEGKNKYGKQYAKRVNSNKE